MLAEFQRDICAWLMHDDAQAASRLGPSAAAGLRIYQNNYRAQLVACLEESFAQTRAWIGHEAFQMAVATHVDRVPPSSWTLDAYPRDFPGTLAILYPADPEIAELAWIDCALGEAFVGPDAAAVTTDVLVGIDWDNAVLRLTPTLDFADLTTNATAIWAALAENREPPAVEFLPETGAVLVWRQGQVSRFRAIDQIERQALAAARSGRSFADLCRALVDLLGHEKGVACGGTLLGQWLADGLIVAVEDRGP